MPYIRLILDPESARKLAQWIASFRIHGLISQLEPEAYLGCHPFHATVVAGISQSFNSPALVAAAVCATSQRVGPFVIRTAAGGVRVSCRGGSFKIRCFDDSVIRTHALAVDAAMRTGVNGKPFLSTFGGGAPNIHITIGILAAGAPAAALEAEMAQQLAAGALGDLCFVAVEFEDDGKWAPPLALLTRPLAGNPGPPGPSGSPGVPGALGAAAFAPPATPTPAPQISCKLCGAFGHTEAQCPAVGKGHLGKGGKGGGKAGKGGQGKGGGNCFACGLPGHRKAQCPDRLVAVAGASEGGGPDLSACFAMVRAAAAGPAAVSAAGAAWDGILARFRQAAAPLDLALFVNSGFYFIAPFDRRDGPSAARLQAAADGAVAEAAALLTALSTNDAAASLDVLNPFQGKCLDALAATAAAIGGPPAYPGQPPKPLLIAPAENRVGLHASVHGASPELLGRHVPASSTRLLAYPMSHARRADAFGGGRVTAAVWLVVELNLPEPGPLSPADGYSFHISIGIIGV